MYLDYHGHRVKLLGAQMESNLFPSANRSAAEDTTRIFVIQNIYIFWFQIDWWDQAEVKGE